MNTTDTSINLGSIETIAFGQGHCFVVNDEEIAVFRQRDGRLFATQNRCPHQQGPLADGLIGDGTVICPLHAHKFDLAAGTGSELGECVKTYAVEQRNGAIILHL